MTGLRYQSCLPPCRTKIQSNPSTVLIRSTRFMARRVQRLCGCQADPHWSRRHKCLGGVVIQRLALGPVVGVILKVAKPCAVFFPIDKLYGLHCRVLLSTPTVNRLSGALRSRRHTCLNSFGIRLTLDSFENPVEGQVCKERVALRCVITVTSRKLDGLNFCDVISLVNELRPFSLAPWRLHLNPASRFSGSGTYAVISIAGEV